ncbi:MAG: ROK family protein [Clostridia bacterium]|nr:ROK family protein [Clostridia bacterium]
MAVDEQFAVGVDIGGTNLRAAIVRGCEILNVARHRGWDPQMQPEAAMDMVSRAILDLMADSGLRPAQVRGIGVGAPGRVDYADRAVVGAVNVPWARGKVRLRVGQMLEQRLGIPVRMENDVAAGAIGEYLFGEFRGSSSFLYVSLGTGVGSCCITGGRIMRGAHNDAYELGHTIIDMHGPSCSCGMFGCIELMAAGPAIAEMAGMSAEAAVHSARRGDPSARDAIDKAVQRLAIGLANAISLLDPEVIVIGGGLSRVGDLIVEPLVEKVKILSCSPYVESIHIRAARFGDDSGIIGAASQFTEAYEALR